MEEENKKGNKLITILLFLFVAFLIMNISKQTIFYEYKAYNKTKLTKEAMKKFENDVSKGLDVSLNDYVEDDYKDYSNIISKTGSSINKGIELFMNKGIKKTLKVLKKLFYE